MYAGIYLGRSPFNEGSVALVLNPETSNVSPQFYVVFDDKISIVTFMREFKMPSKWTYIVQLGSKSGEPEKIDIKDT